MSTPFELLLKYHIDGLSDTYYEFRVYLDQLEGDHKRSTLKVVAHNKTLFQRNLMTTEVMAIVNATQSIKLKFGNKLGSPEFFSHVCPSFDYRLVINSKYFRLDFKWNDNDIDEYPAMLKSLMKIVKVFDKIHPVDYQELKLLPKE